MQSVSCKIKFCSTSPCSEGDGGGDMLVGRQSVRVGVCGFFL